MPFWTNDHLDKDTVNYKNESHHLVRFWHTTFNNPCSSIERPLDTSKYRHGFVNVQWGRPLPTFPLTLADYICLSILCPLIWSIFRNHFNIILSILITIPFISSQRCLPVTFRILSPLVTRRTWEWGQIQTLHSIQPNVPHSTGHHRVQISIHFISIHSPVHILLKFTIPHKHTI